MNLYELDKEDLLQHIRILESELEQMEEKMEYFREGLIECEKEKTYKK